MVGVAGLAAMIDVLCLALPCCAVLCCVLLQLWDREGKHVRTLASLPLAEDIPIAFNSCRTGAIC
jgi:hypothetical protein